MVILTHILSHNYHEPNHSPAPANHWEDDPARDLEGVLVAVVLPSKEGLYNESSSSDEDQSAILNLRADGTRDMMPLATPPEPGRIVASVRLFNRELFVHGRTVQCGGIGEVCTLEGFRGRGLARCGHGVRGGEGANPYRLLTGSVGYARA